MEAFMNADPKVFAGCLCQYDPEMWFSPSLADQSYCKSMCRKCPALAACRELVDALEGDKPPASEKRLTNYRGEVGIWAGMTPLERWCERRGGRGVGCDGGARKG